MSSSVYDEGNEVSGPRWREDGDRLYFAPRLGAAWELAATRDYGGAWEAAPGYERLVRERTPIAR